jgi:hypothetical protein
VAAWKERGQKPPKQFVEAVSEEGLEDEPELDWVEQQIVVLFSVASTCRPVSMGGALPIPYTAVAEVLDRHGWSGPEFHTAAHLLRLMDNLTLEHYASVSKSGGK